MKIHYAIGDIHGRFDLLQALLVRIERHAAEAEAEKTLVYLGDYVDRGPQSADVIDLIMGGPPDGIGRQICLLGNHEDLMLRALDGKDRFGDWYRNGGRETERSYKSDFARLKRHEQWLRKRPTFLHESGFYFVHAGVAPGRPLDQQRRVHQLWIRNRFLWSRRNHGAVIVHGHTVVGKRPIVRRNRISIDTGAYRTGVLTCAVLHQGVEPEFLQTFVG